MPHAKVVASGRLERGTLKIGVRRAFDQALAKLPDGDYTVIVMQPGDQRSSQQNRRYWGGLIGAMSDHCGYTSYEAHNIVKGMFLARRAGACDHVGMEIVGDARIDDSTTQLCTRCFGLYMDDVEMWLGSEFGIGPKETAA
jgi:hypothetical protein